MRFRGSGVRAYVIAQLLGGIAAAALLHYIASGAPGFDPSGGLAANGDGDHSPGHYSLAGFAPIAIGLGLTLIHLISIPVTGSSVNPARSTGPAVIMGGWALGQLWLFWLAPLMGAGLGGVLYRWLAGDGELR